MKQPTLRSLLSIPTDGRAFRRGSRSTVVAAVAVLSGLSAAAAATNGVTVEKSWMRLITKTRPAAGYFTLRNDTASAVLLTGASSTRCRAVMLHQSKEVGGVEKMLSVKSVSVPAHGSVSFSPGGYHLMCMSPDDLTVSGHIPVTLELADGKTVTALFAVQGVNAGSGPK